MKSEKFIFYFQWVSVNATHTFLVRRILIWQGNPAVNINGLLNYSIVSKNGKKHRLLLQFRRRHFMEHDQIKTDWRYAAKVLLGGVIGAGIGAVASSYTHGNVFWGAFNGALGGAVGAGAGAQARGGRAIGRAYSFVGSMIWAGVVASLSSDDGIQALATGVLPAGVSFLAANLTRPSRAGRKNNAAPVFGNN